MCRTSIYAAMTVSATVGHRFVIGINVKGNEYLAKEEHRTCMRNDKLVVAPHPAQSSLLRPVAFKDGGRIAEAAYRKIFFQRERLSVPYFFCQLPHLFFHQVVVVLTECIGCKLVFSFREQPGWRIVECKRNDDAGRAVFPGSSPCKP